MSVSTESTGDLKWSKLNLAQKNAIKKTSISRSTKSVSIPTNVVTQGTSHSHASSSDLIN